MKTIKTYKIAVIAFLISTLNFSCEKDFLDPVTHRFGPSSGREDSHFQV